MSQPLNSSNVLNSSQHLNSSKVLQNRSATPTRLIGSTGVFSKKTVCPIRLYPIIYAFAEIRSIRIEQRLGQQPIGQIAAHAVQDNRSISQSSGIVRPYAGQDTE